MQVYHYELFYLDADPWELHNSYSTASEYTAETLHRLVTEYYHCQGNTCP